MPDLVAAWSTFALALISILALRVSYWGIKRQTESFAASVSADLALKLVDRFDSPPLKDMRSLAARALLDKNGLDLADDVFDFFETLGLYVRRNAIDGEIAHAMFFHWVNLYWNAGKDYIVESQKRSKGIWSEFGYLYDVLLQIELKQDARSRDINPTPEDVRKLLEQEIIA